MGSHENGVPQHRGRVEIIFGQPSPAEKRRRLRELLAGPEPIVAPGVYDCLSARLAQRAGFEAALITGSGIAASVLGVPDVGLTTMSEVLGQTRNIARAVAMPVIADCDTGYGNAINVMRTVQEFEAAGVAALFIEDQVAPKRCGHFEGKQVVAAGEMVAKLRAAVQARTDPSLVLVARTDALGLLGLDEAIRRAKAYAAAGADVLFVEAPETVEQLAALGRELHSLGTPLLVNLVEGGKTPLLSAGELGAMGFKLITLSGSLQKTAIKAMDELLASVRGTGSVAGAYPARMVSLDERSELLGLADFLSLQRRLATDD